MTETGSLQFQEAKSENHPIITCGCGARVPLRFMYRCYYCFEYFCESCAPMHFGATRDEYEKNKELMSKGDV